MPWPLRPKSECMRIGTPEAHVTGGLHAPLPLLGTVSVMNSDQTSPASLEPTAEDVADVITFLGELSIADLVEVSKSWSDPVFSAALRATEPTEGTLASIREKTVTRVRRH